MAQSKAAAAPGKETTAGIESNRPQPNAFPARPQALAAPHHLTENQAAVSARLCIHSIIDYGDAPPLDLTAEEMPTDELREVLAAVLPAVREGIREYVEVLPYVIANAKPSRAESIKFALLECCDSAYASDPSDLVAAAQVVRAHHRSRRQWQIIHGDMPRAHAAGESVAALVDELRALEAGTSDRLESRLDERAFNHHEQPEHPEPIFQLLGKSILTAGNLANIQAPAKAGKSAVLAAMMASTMATRTDGDMLGFSSTRAGGALVHIDTEQSRFDHDSLVRRALRRAGIDEPPPWLMSYCLTDLDVTERRQALRILCERAANRHNGIHAILIDGVGDMATDPNDAGESFALVDEFVRLAARYETGILTVLHENPGSESGKTRGHLGSQLERKAESNLRMAKDKDGISTIWAERARSCYLPRDAGPCFAWSDEQKMHVTVGTAGELRHAEALEKHESAAAEAFLVKPVLTYGELCDRIMATAGLKDRSAKLRVKQWSIDGIIRKTQAGSYELAR